MKRKIKYIGLVRKGIWVTLAPLKITFTFILFNVFYLLPHKMGLRERYCRFWYHNFFERAHSLRNRILPRYMTYHRETKYDYTLEPLLDNTDNEDIVIRFSGGSDSTLVSAIMAERFRRVHLLTFGHAGLLLRNLDKSRIAVGYLIKKYGSDKFIHKIFNVEDLRMKFYFKDYFSDFLKFGFYRSNVCAACSLSQHMKVISYCKKYRIRYASDGITSWRGHRIAFSQMFAIAQLIKKLYEEYDIHYIINPSYNQHRSDHELYRRGITPIKDIKWTEHHFETQSGCYIGKFLIECAKGYYLPLYGKNSLRKIAPRYYLYKLNVCKQLIDDGFATRGI